MSTLHQTINSLAAEFAHSLLKSLRGASLQEILAETAVKKGRPAAVLHAAATHHVATPAAPKKRGGRRLHRRTTGDITSVVGHIVALLKTHKKGLRAEEIRAKLGIDRSEIPRPLAEALHKKLVTKRGVKRATTYFHK